jgi:hypothetical protein
MVVFAGGVMEQYLLPGREIRAMLEEKGVEFLYHANTVLTSLTFLKAGALLSRGYVEANGLVQTEQRSDAEDKEFDVWDHVFLDAMDLHQRWNRPNIYGPVLFKIKLDLLSSPKFPGCYVTKGNPMYWKGFTPMASRFYSKIETLRDDFLSGKKQDGRIMFTFRAPGTGINLSKYLDSVIIDTPRILFKTSLGTDQTVGEYIKSAIMTGLVSNHLGHIPLLFRHEAGVGWCKCLFAYNYLWARDNAEMVKRFRRV